MANDIGYTKNLFILPFDHRSSFVKDMFGIQDQNLTAQETQIIIAEKKIIYEGFKKAVEEDVPKGETAILVDEQFGDKILQDARTQGFTTCVTTEKSGQKEFTFEYGNNFAAHVEKYKPIFAKALIHYNPEDEDQSKSRQQQQLRILSDYCHNNGYKFLLEVLIPPSSTSEESFGHLRGDYKAPPRWTSKERFDKEMRPKLAVKMIEELQNVGVEPDVWKLEGMETIEDYQAVVKQAKSGGRDNVGIVVLGRGEDQKQVEKWISVGAKVKGVIGFAVGRTVFWQPLVDLKNGKISKEQAIAQIANNFKYFYDMFMKEKIKN